MADKVGITIIGAGVVGLAIAAELSKEHQDILVLEKNEKYGMETSSRNSEVIHAGLYYPPGSLKLKLCLEGNRLLYEICQNYDIKHKRYGKIVVAANSEEEQEIQKIFENTRQNGVPEVSLKTKEEIARLEPNIFARVGIYSGTTGVIDSHGLMRYFHDEAVGRGVMFGFNNDVTSIRKVAGGYELKTKAGEEIESEMVINSAGLSSDKIARLAGIDTYRLYYCKGDYFSISGAKGMLNRLVYPVPHEKGYGLGVHATLDLGGEIRLGPDATYVNEVSYDIDEKKADAFYQAARKYLPWVKKEKLGPDTSGMRPKLQGPNDEVKDFVIKEDLPGFINLVGIESPGLTASPAIAREVSRLVGK
ncbi:NAD(P)/FAD-dependent oxidoreductase [Candidatus Saganbacteria bacterium]|nr:NAD(P)/FAD-dependent oxidoreductase [Candidatus Saganbacteria bacterium]